MKITFPFDKKRISGFFPSFSPVMAEVDKKCQIHYHLSPNEKFTGLKRENGFSGFYKNLH